jgi:glycosyltransferase involved in cell wall biosynthesis
VKLLIVTEDKYPPFRPDVAVLFAEEMARRGHKIDWLLQAEDARALPEVVQWGGGAAWVAKTDTGVSRLSKLRKNILDICNDLRMFTLARRHRYDIVQVKDKFLAALVAIVVAKLYGLKFVYWLSYPFPEAILYRVDEGISRYPYLDLLRGHVLKLLLYRIIAPAAAHIFVQSEQMRIDVAAMGVPQSKLTAVPMGVSLQRLPAVSDQADSSDKIVVYLGALDKVRRIDFLLAVFAEVLRRVPDAQLYLIGSSVNPADTADLRALAMNLGIEQAVTFTGFLPTEEGWRHVARAAIGVSPLYPSPIYRPASPTKLIEYMAMSKAVVVNDHPEQRQVIEESGGGICVSYDERAFADALVELLNDPDLAKEMGMRGRRYVQEHRSYRILADRVERRYAELLAGTTAA